jgi:exopolysaccharide biosynthesis polyprenyl glycosylphosphotransferase
MSFPALNPESSNLPASPCTGPVNLPVVPRRTKVQSSFPDGIAAPTHLAGFTGWQPVAKRQPGRDTARNVLIVGAGSLGREMAAILKSEPAAGRTVIGFLDASAPVTGDVLGRVEDLTRVARTQFVDEIILAIPDQHLMAQRVVREARRNRLDIRVIPDFYDSGQVAERGGQSGRLLLEYFGNLPVLTLHEERKVPAGLIWKRVIDIGFSAAALLMATPVLVMIALAIKLASPGRVFYRAQRVGLKGRRFACYKFRTMVANADRLKDKLRGRNEREGPCFKIADDPRITRLGRFLRRYSLDELPQLWNVLRGEMSLVGPRPHPLDDFAQYRLDHFRRLDVTPGITGLWQITARRDPSFQRIMALDLEYIEGWSLMADLRILLKNVFVILRGSGA